MELQVISGINGTIIYSKYHSQIIRLGTQVSDAMVAYEAGCAKSKARIQKITLNVMAANVSAKLLKIH